MKKIVSKRSTKTKAFFRLRSILLMVNLTILLLPLLGIFFFRFYENALVRQTEQELISQAAVLSSVYKQEIKKHIADNTVYGIPAEEESLIPVDEYYTPVNPRIDLSSMKLLPPRPDGTTGNPDPLAFAVGELLIPLVADTIKTTLSGIRILDYNGIVVSGSSEISRNFSLVPEIQPALLGYYSSVIRKRISDTPPPALASLSRGTGIRVFVAFPIIEEDRVWGVIYLSRTPPNILKQLYSEKEKVLIATITILGLTFVIALLTSHMISRPLDRLVEKTKQIAGGNLEAMQPMSKPGVKEIELLSKSFSDMAITLKERADYINEFAMHVSHEFKTPITSIQGSAELLQEHMDQMEAKEKEKFLSNIMADSHRLKQLVSRLLELARADNITETDGACSLKDALETTQSKYSALGLSIELHDIPEAVIPISQDNMETVLNNLCDNALQNSATKIQINYGVKNGETKLKFDDNGNGISQANKEKVFTPFFTTRRANGGTGMGLGIVSSILLAHGATIRLCDQKNTNGACFEITF